MNFVVSRKTFPPHVLLLHTQTIYRFLFIWPGICFPQTYRDSTASENVIALTNLDFSSFWSSEDALTHAMGSRGPCFLGKVD